MRTTINIDEQLLVYTKLQAVWQGCTLKQVIEDVLRESFSRYHLKQDPVKLETVSGAGLKPGINLQNKGVRPHIKYSYLCMMSIDL